MLNAKHTATPRHCLKAYLKLSVQVNMHPEHQHDFVSKFEMSNTYPFFSVLLGSISVGVARTICAHCK